jgi:peptidase M66-like protein
MTCVRSGLRFRLQVLVTVLAALAVAGCNMITGADKIRIGDRDDDDESLSGAGAGSGSGAGSGTASGGSGGSGNGGSSSGSAGAPAEPMGPVDGVSLDAVLVYQAVSRPLMQNGGPVGTSVPIVAGRDALVRVFYTASGGYNGQTVTARLTIAGTPLEVTGTLGGSSSESDPESTLNFFVAGSQMGENAGFRVDLLQPVAMTSGQNTAARYPTDASAEADLEAEAGTTLTVTLVPVQYNGDGSGRLPDTTAGQLQAYTDLFYAIYPVANVAIQVRPAIAWNGYIGAGGNGWGDLLNSMADLRQSDNAASDNYYYGIFSPASSFGNYCGGGCVLGLGFIGAPNDDYSRAAIGVGFSGDVSTETAVHEVGHNHGRPHAPCGGASGTDPSYPYGGASIGVWGYNLVSQQLYPPNDFVDMMSYCHPQWISDYNYEQIFDHIQFSNGAAIAVPQAQQNLSYTRVMLHADGSTSWLPGLTMARPPIGEATSVTVQTQNGSEQVAGAFYRYDHLDGGVLFVPPTQAPMLVAPQAISAYIDGQLISSP